MAQFARGLRLKTRRLAKDRSGVVAIEFILVAPVLLFLVFAILETAFLYLTATVMEGEVATAARAIRTGNVQKDADPEAYFEEILCDHLENVLDCSKVVYDIRTYDSFDAMTFPDYYDEDGDPEDSQFEPGEAGEVVLVRIAYRYTIITPFLADLLSPDGSGTITLQAAAAFQNEPFHTL